MKKLLEIFVTTNNIESTHFKEEGEKRAHGEGLPFGDAGHEARRQ
jgi:hypothetical protein